MPTNKIDPNLNLGLHQLADPKCFGFPLGNAKEQTEVILSQLDKLVEHTIDKCPVRTKKALYLDRTTDSQPRGEEAKWERAMHRKWGPKSSGEYVAVCPRIQTYQYPLKELCKDERWGRVDLLGIGADLLPVPNELKKRKSDESPLRMLVEVAAYGFAIRKVWPKLKDNWIECVSRFGTPTSQFPESLDKVTLICVAPEEYWDRCLARFPKTKAGKFPAKAWPPFWDLVDALGKWFDIHFVAVKGSWEDTGMPTITGARIIDLRSDSIRASRDG